MIIEQLSAAVVLDEGVDPSLVESTLPPPEKLNVTCVAPASEATRALEDPEAQVLVVASSSGAQEATGVIRRSRAERPDRPVVALCESAPDYFVHALFQAGADDVVKLPDTPERVLFTLEKALARHQGRVADDRATLAPMICVLGPKGGTGKTVTASNLAMSLSKAGKRTVIVDLDLQFGDVGLALGMQPQRTGYDLATSGGALDAEKLDAYLINHESGLRALLAPVRPDQASAVSTELMRTVFALLRSTHDAVVVDTPPDFTPHVIAAIDVSSHICMVGTLDSLSLKNTKLGLETLDLMGYDPAAISLVLNRANTSVGLTRDDVETIVGRPPDVLVPSDRDVPRSINQGEPIVSGQRRSPVAAAFRSLAELYLDDAAALTQLNEASVNGDGNGQGPESGRLRLIGGWRR